VIGGRGRPRGGTTTVWRTAVRLLLAGVTVALAACAAQRLDLRTLPATFSVGAVERYGPGIVAIDSTGEVVTFALAGAAEVALVAVTSDGRVRPLYPLLRGESSSFDGGAHTIAVPVGSEWRPLPSAPATASAARQFEAWRAYNRCAVAARTTMSTRASSAAASGTPADSSRRMGTGRPTGPETTDPLTTVNVDQTCGAPPVGEGGAAPLSAGRFEARDDVVLLVVSGAPLASETLRRRVAGLRIASAGDLRGLPQRIAGDPSSAVAGYYSWRFPIPRMQEHER
jgi:hypothetical protein